MTNDLQPTTYNLQRGVSLYIALMVLSVLLSLALGISAILLSQIQLLRGIGHSVLAFAAAETGIELVLEIDASSCSDSETIEERITCIRDALNALPGSEFQLSNGATFQVTVEAADEGGCPEDKNYCVRSTGLYLEARRSIRAGR
ncbi:MAG TPA: hypothetical protein VI954_01870 [Candidatus Paceibacterota bacterium]